MIRMLSPLMLPDAHLDKLYRRDNPPKGMVKESREIKNIPTNGRYPKGLVAATMPEVPIVWLSFTPQSPARPLLLSGGALLCNAPA